MGELKITSLLHSPISDDPASFGEALRLLGRQIGGRDLAIYLVDYGQTSLQPFVDASTRSPHPTSEEVGSTMAGRAFLNQEAVHAPRPDGYRIWVPIKVGSNRTGVLAVTMDNADEATLMACSDLGTFAGYLIALHERTTDAFTRFRRRASMSLAASMQWDLLPPLVFNSPGVTVAGYIEPAYEVGGTALTIR